MRRRWRSSSPRPMKAVIACCSIRAVDWSESDFSWRTASSSAAGTAIQPRLSAGASVLEAEPA